MNKTVISLDSWQIKTFLTCEEMFRLAYKEHQRRIVFVPPEKRYTDKGSLVHAILGIYYTLRALKPKEDRLKHGTATIQLVKKNKLVQKAGFDDKFEEFIIQRFQQYLFTYIYGDFIPTFRNGVVGVEVPFAIKLYEDDHKVYILEGRIDLIGDYLTLGKAFVDHKTQDRISNLYKKKIQFLCYSLATGLEYGVINYFGLQKELKNEVSLRQTIIHIPKSYTETFKKYIIEQVFDPIYAHEVMSKSGKSTYKRNWNSCSGPNEKWPCSYSPICEAEDPEVQALLKQQYYETVPPWSPWNEQEQTINEE